MIALHPALGLRRTGRDDLDSQPLAYAPKLRHRRRSVQQLLGRRLAHVNVFPIRVERPRHAVFLHPGSQHAHRAPDGFLLAHPAELARPATSHPVPPPPPPPSFFPPLLPPP